MGAIVELASAATSTTLPVLITGESGVGKEHLARAIHAAGPGAAEPFVVANLGATPEDEFDAEVFGTEAAVGGAAHVGHFERAGGGTLFLDDIGRLSARLQVRLLRVLQERTLRRVGGTRTVDVPARVIAATSEDVGQAVVDGRFRQDLYYRLAVIHVHLPPLRERREDLQSLFRHFALQAAARVGTAPVELQAVMPALLPLLMRHPWPGNIRELENAVMRLVVEGGPLRTWEARLRSLLAGNLLAQQAVGKLDASLEETIDAAVATALRQVSGDAAEAARRLGISRATVYRRMRRREDGGEADPSLGGRR
jgi:DNA-binding NtrC family response regulator